MKFFTKTIVLVLLGMNIAHAGLVGIKTTITASWYGKWHHGKLMANGKPFDMHNPALAAHKTLPLGTLLLVRNASNGKALVAVVTDRGPYKEGRSLDISYAGAKYLGFADQGLAKLEIQVLKHA